LNRRTSQSGFTLLEVLISVVLMAALLAAVALATHASLNSYDENARAAALTQTVRVLSMRLQREVRSAEAIDYQADDGELIIFPPTNPEGLEQIRYEYDGGTKTLYYHQQTAGETVTSVVMNAASPVVLNSFAVDYETTQIGSLTCTQRVRVTMTFQVGQATSTVVFSAAPRRNHQY